MNPQFKKGVLELIVLKSVRDRDMYGYELVTEVSKVIDVNEGTIYPLLKRLTNEHYFETYLRESTEPKIRPGSIIIYLRPGSCMGISWRQSGMNFRSGSAAS